MRCYCYSIASRLLSSFQCSLAHPVSFAFHSVFCPSTLLFSSCISRSSIHIHIRESSRVESTLNRFASSRRVLSRLVVSRRAPSHVRLSTRSLVFSFRAFSATASAERHAHCTNWLQPPLPLPLPLPFARAPAACRLQLRVVESIRVEPSAGRDGMGRETRARAGRASSRVIRVGLRSTAIDYSFCNRKSQYVVLASFRVAPARLKLNGFDSIRFDSKRCEAVQCRADRIGWHFEPVFVCNALRLPAHS